MEAARLAVSGKRLGLPSLPKLSITKAIKQKAPISGKRNNPIVLAFSSFCGTDFDYAQRAYVVSKATEQINGIQIKALASCLFHLLLSAKP